MPWEILIAVLSLWKLFAYSAVIILCLLLPSPLMISVYYNFIFLRFFWRRCFLCRQPAKDFIFVTDRRLFHYHSECIERALNHPEQLDGPYMIDCAVGLRRELDRQEHNRKAWMAYARAAIDPNRPAPPHRYGPVPR